MNNPLVSWLIPVYNSEKTIARAIDSILTQTYQNFIIIIVIEQGCSDRTYEICAEYAAKDNRIKIYRNNDKLGIAKSLNRGLKLCKGKYIARMDADDYCYPDRLEKQINFLENNPECGLLGSFMNISDLMGKSIVKYPVDDTNIKAGLLFETQFSHPTIIMRTDVVLTHHIEYPLDISEDYAMWIIISSLTKLANLPEPLVVYGLSDEQLTSKNFLLCRKSSADISKRTIKDFLGVDTLSYPDSYFGCRKEYDVPDNIEDYLKKGAKLLLEIKLANKTLKRYDCNALDNILRIQWGKTKQIALLSCFPINYENNFFEYEDLVIRCVDVYSKKQKVLLYGMGIFCEEIIRNINEYKFDIAGICDSDINKKGEVFYGAKIISPSEIHLIDYDYILISSTVYSYEIFVYLTDTLCIEEQKILPLLTLNEMIYYRNKFHRESL